MTYTVKPALECFKPTPFPDMWEFDADHAIRILETLGYQVIRPEKEEQ